MCAARHQYRPVAANEGGGSGAAIDPDFDPSVGPCMGPQHLTAPKSKSPTSVYVLVRLHFPTKLAEGFEPPTC